jgi:hypothetical protein
MDPAVLNSSAPRNIDFLNRSREAIANAKRLSASLAESIRVSQIRRRQLSEAFDAITIIKRNAGRVPPRGRQPVTMSDNLAQEMIGMLTEAGFTAFRWNGGPIPIITPKVKAIQ